MLGYAALWSCTWRRTSASIFFLVGFCFFLFLNKRKKLLASAPVSFHCNTAHSCEFTCVNLGCHKPGSTEVVILIWGNTTCIHASEFTASKGFCCDNSKHIMFQQLTLPSIARSQKAAMLESYSIKKVQLHQIFFFCKIMPLSVWKWGNYKKKPRWRGSPGNIKTVCSHISWVDFFGVFH